MEKHTNPIVRVFSFLFAILLVITAVVTILLINVSIQTFNTEMYKQSLSSSGIYDRLPLLIGEQIVYSVNRNPCIQDPTNCTEEQGALTPAYLSSVDAAEWAIVISKLVDPTWFKTQIESAIDQVIASLITPGQPFTLNISLLDLKARLGGEDGYQAVVSLLNSLEPCTIDDLFILPGAALNADNPASIPLCRPSETVLKLGESAIRDSLKSAADKLPDNTASLFETPMPGMETGLAVTQRGIQLLRTAALISPAIPLFLLLVVTILVVRSFKGFLSWWGFPLLATGVMTLLTSLLITPVVRVAVLARVNAFDLAPGLIEVAKATIISAMESLRNALAFQAVILCIIGAVMVVAAGLIKHKSEHKTS